MRGFPGPSVSPRLSCPGVVGVCLSGYLIETTGSWTCVFHLVAIISNLGLGTFLVFGKAQRVDLAPTHEDL